MLRTLFLFVSRRLLIPLSRTAARGSRKRTNKGRAAVEELAKTAAAAATCPVLAFDDDTAIS